MSPIRFPSKSELIAYFATHELTNDQFFLVSKISEAVAHNFCHKKINSSRIHIGVWLATSTIKIKLADQGTQFIELLFSQALRQLAKKIKFEHSKK